MSNTTADLRFVDINSIKRKEQGTEEAKQARRLQRPMNPATKEDFNFVKVVGQGSYGKVFLVLHKQTKKYHAMKVIKKELVFGTR